MLIENIELKRINLIIGKKPILKDVNLKIYKNDKIAIIGPSGAGKTQLLLILALMNKPSNGKIIYNLVDPWTIKPSILKKIRKSYFFVPQNLPLPLKQKVVTSIQAGYIANWSLLKVIMSLIYPLKYKEIYSVLDHLNLKDKLFEKVGDLSGGEKQCVSLARLLVSNANIMIADEPLNSLDPSKSELILNNITKHYLKNKSTLICSLHQPQYAKKYFDRIIGIKNSRIRFDVSTKKLTKKLINDLYN
tara:strand:- start:931 stop:1671 length:741 start_codon:yes stop_codon:yes gene_type:complete